jgi:ferritin-like metal-binding protein YciE
MIGFFSGIYIGSSTMSEKHKEESLHQQRVVSNCLEVIIGKRPKGKVCQK